MKNKQNRTGANNKSSNSTSMKNDYLGKPKIPNAVTDVITDQNGSVQSDMNSGSTMSSKKKNPPNNSDQIY